MTFVQVDAAKQDRELVRKQAELVAAQLREEEREMAARIVDGLLEQLAATERDLDEARADLAVRKPGKTGARGTVNNGGKAVHGAAQKKTEHKHSYGPDGVCRKFALDGVVCLGKRQRETAKSRAARAAATPGPDGALPGQVPLIESEPAS